MGFAARTSQPRKNFFIHSTISILTASRVTPSFAGVGHVAFAPKPVHQLQTLWNGIRHWWRRESGRFMEEIVMISLDLCAFLAIGLALLRKRALQRCRLTSEPAVQLDPTRVPVAWIEIPSIEGLLFLYSFTSNSTESPDQWRGLWISRRKYTYYLSYGPVNRDEVLFQSNAADSALLGMLLRSLWSYHPWAPQLSEIHLATQDNFMTSEPTVQPQGLELRSIQRPHLRPAIERLGGFPTQVISEVVGEVVYPKREHDLVEHWIKIPSDEGILILYAHSTRSQDSPCEWTSQYFPCQPHTYYLSDRPANLDSLLLGILLLSISIYHPWAPQLAGIILDIPGEVVEETDVIAATNSALEVEVITVPPTCSGPTTSDPTCVIDTLTIPVNRVKSSPEMGLEALGLLEDLGDPDGSDNNRVKGTATLLYPALSLSICNGDDTTPPPSEPAFPQLEASHSQIHRTTLPGSSFPPYNYSTLAYQLGPTVYHPYTTSGAYQHIPAAYHSYTTPLTYQPPPMVYNPYTTPVPYHHIPTVYHQRPTHMMMPATGFWVGGSTGCTEEGVAEENALEETEKIKFRRGGRRNTARKHRLQERERRNQNEGNPGAGPSSFRST
ncbi:hypothetical protein M407DRAFT_218271 [Tulasnella calospora MUT 4182]|uniref:Uncharacterized protein n=1 Tax=Tulasnella calospora MUT 4182 TaxID=1051891 RepID=A0A0C3Q0B4_9AGAM|nr:hypothetical protein M407DRAFT_218271 [Tulasnella calospora MUT 4182]